MDPTKNKPIISAGRFSLFLDQSLETKGGNPCLKNQSLSKLFYTKGKLDLRDIWRIQNPKAKQYILGNKISLVLFKDAEITFLFLRISMK